VNEHLMRAVVQLVWYVDSLESEDPDVVLKVLEGVVAELHSLSDDDRRRFVNFVEAEAEAADSSPAGRDYREFLRGDFPELAGLREPPVSGK
jgi:hypothetical protein